VTVWADLRDNALGNRVLDTCDDVALGCCDAWNRLAGQGGASTSRALPATQQNLCLGPMTAERSGRIVVKAPLPPRKRPMPKAPLIAVTALLLAAGVVPASGRVRHHHHAATRTFGSSRGRAAPASHAGIPQSANIENLNDLSLRRAHAGENTNRPLAAPLAQ